MRFELSKRARDVQKYNLAKMNIFYFIIVVLRMDFEQSAFVFFFASLDENSDEGKIIQKK